ncbi:hypothetical protein FEM48_Zijuj01G0126700 [Ziziphus jujuba var. spinosa]|uniref:Uncharacterized protein n=1 Tax=Ziziphus jujuba var. spinosa TaxID=714518 RepID=A0A978W1B4_ZIZJJ|nr:hypothetical protein FEM48_Zijuj01G0126700 [Ziziphus jujuba var. spinosa]
MVELQSCASLVNASALCAIEQEVKAESVSNSVAEISAELQRERQKNAELSERISFLESQIRQILDKQSFPSHEIENYPALLERNFKKLKRQKTENPSNGIESENLIKSTENASQKSHDTKLLSQKEPMLENRLVNWMSMDETQFLQYEKAKDGDSTADCDDTDDSDDDEDDDYHEEDHGDDNNHKEGQAANGSSKLVNELKNGVLSSSAAQNDELAFSSVNQEGNRQLPDMYPLCDGIELGNQQSKDVKSIGNYKALQGSLTMGNETCKIGFGSTSQNKKPPKVAFCSKEVKRIIESEGLKEKNAQSHTIRKIIVFASLGIRHGCEDIYELDFNHFSILRKGEAYVSPTNPGEHVLYENPGVRRKVFYPNRQNPILCPVQILEEEKAMRPSDASCPSFLFLCIKYVRQRMGRNKLKSFGPLMCRMAMLVHIRSGSFFFKALGITLLFMAGFPDDLVQRETKYRNLDLLQKYYRTDEDAEREELFLPYSTESDTQASPSTQQFTGKNCSTKSKGKKQSSSITKPHNTQRLCSFQQSMPLSSEPPHHQFGLMGYSAIHTHAMAAFQSAQAQSQTPLDVSSISNTVTSSSGTNNATCRNQTPYQMLPPQPANAFMPLMYWPPPNTYPPGPYTSSYGGYRSFPSSGNYISIHPQPYYSHPSCSPFIPKMASGVKNDIALMEEASTDSDSSSSSIEPKENS